MAVDPAYDRGHDPDDADDVAEDLRRPTLTMKVAGQTLQVTVSSDGEFWAEWEGEGFRSTSFKDLRAKLTKVIRVDLKRCSIPMTLVEYHDELQPITLIGLHAGNDNLLYLDAEGKTHQTRSATMTLPLTAAEVKEFAALKAAVKAANAAQRAWIKQRAANPVLLIRAALKLPPVVCDKRHGYGSCHDPKCYQRLDDHADEDE